MEKKKIILPKLRYENAPEVDSQLRVGFEEEKSLLRTDDRDVVLNLSEQFATERANSKKYKLYGKMKMVFRNMFAGNTDYLYLRERLVLTGDGSDGCFGGHLPYNEFAFLRTDLYREVASEEIINDLADFTGFTIGVSGTTVHQSITVNDAYKNNWNLYLTYVYSHDDSYPMKYTLSGNTAVSPLSFVSGDGIPFRVSETSTEYVLTSPVKHGMNQGEYIVINSTPYYINSVGSTLYNSENYVITLLKSQFGGTLLNGLINGKRCTDLKDIENSTSEYYIHQHKVLTNVNQYLIDKVGFESPIWEDEKKLIYENSAGINDLIVERNRMESVLFDYFDPFVLTGITNNLGYTPTELYTTVIFRNGNGYFDYPPKLGYSFHFHDSWVDQHFYGIGSKEITISGETFTRSGVSGTITFKKGLPIPAGTILNGAFVEYNPKEMKERIISEAFHKIVVSELKIFNHGQTLPEVYSGSSIYNPTGLYYQPHYRFKLRELSPYTETSDSDKIDNLPENARYFPNEKLWRWRDLYDEGYVDPDGYGTDYPYINDTHYVHRDINFYLRNEQFYINKKDGIIDFYKNQNVDDCAKSAPDNAVPIVTNPTPSVTPTIPPSITPSKTPTVTPSVSRTPSVTPSVSITPSISASISVSITPSISVSDTPCPTRTPNLNVTPSPSVTPTPSITPSITPSVTPSITPSISASATPSVTPSITPSVTPSVSITPSASPSITPSISASEIASPSVTPSITPSITPSTSMIVYSTCSPYGIHFQTYSEDLIGLLTVSGVTLSSGTLGNYRIDWNLNSTSGTTVFVTGNSGNTDPSIQAFHPINSELIQAGELYPVLRYININGTNYTPYAGMSGYSYSPDLLTCLPAITVLSMSCSNGETGSTWDHSIVYTNATMPSTVANRSLTYMLNSDGSSYQIAYQMYGYTVADRFTLNYVTSGGTETLMDDWVVGSDCTGTTIGSPSLYQGTELIRSLILTGFTYQNGDYLLFKVSPSYNNPGQTDTNWRLDIKCFTIEDPIQYYFAPNNTGELLTGTTGMTMTWDSGACRYDFTYHTVGGGPSYLPNQDILHYNEGWCGGSFDFSDTKHIYFASYTGCSYNYGCSNRWYGTPYLLNGQLNIALTGTSTTHVLRYTFTNSTDYQHYKDGYAITSGCTDWTNWTSDIHDLNHYKTINDYFRVSMTSGDTTTSYQLFISHESEFIFDDSGKTITVNLAPQTYGYTGGTCNNCVNDIAAYATTTNNFYSGTSFNYNTIWGTQYPFAFWDYYQYVNIQTGATQTDYCYIQKMFYGGAGGTLAPNWFEGTADWFFYKAYLKVEFTDVNDPINNYKVWNALLPDGTIDGGQYTPNWTLIKQVP